jgi:hypothetical protein
MEQQTIPVPVNTVNKKKIILISFGVLATGAAGYFGYHQWKQHKAKKATKKELEKESSDTNSDTSADTTATAAPPKSSAFHIPATLTLPVRNDDFPLKRNSKGPKVKQLQQALIALVGKDVLGTKGADGSFGSKTEAALIKAGYPIIVKESTFNVLLKAGGLDATTTAKDLYNAASQKDFAKSIAALSKLGSKEDYKAVSDQFKSYVLRDAHQNLVNGMLSSFSDDKQKQAIRLEFTRMGLGYDGNTWSLSGFDTADLVTTQPTLVWLSPKAAIKVPAGMVLGKQITQHGRHTVFEHKGRQFLVDTHTIKTI